MAILLLTNSSFLGGRGTLYQNKTPLTWEGRQHISHAEWILLWWMNKPINWLDGAMEATVQLKILVETNDWNSKINLLWYKFMNYGEKHDDAFCPQTSVLALRCVSKVSVEKHLKGQCFSSSVSKFLSCFLICRLSPWKLAGSSSDSWMRTLTMATLTWGELPFLLLLFCIDFKVSEHLIKGTPSPNCARKKIQTAAVQGWIPCCFLPEVAPPPPACVLCSGATASHFHDSGSQAS